MLLSFKIRHRHSIATLVLFVWLATLFISVAQACLSAPASNQPATAITAIDVVAHEACADNTSSHHPAACKLHCDAQAQDLAKAKSFDPFGGDRPLRISTGFSPFRNPDGGIVVNALSAYSLLYDPNISLRFTRLTL